jgi:glycerol-3-phosphate dehydrogenase
MDTFDIVIIGGGINGAGIAKIASENGLKTAVFEMNDFASGTSSASTKLIHGGLRYLQNFEFALVHKALKERQILLETYPELIEPIKFTFNIGKNPVKYIYYRVGLFIYDHLYIGNKLPKTTTSWDNGFNLEFYDCKVDDSRLVITNLLEAKAFGASIKNYHEVLFIKHSGENFILTVRNSKTDKLSEFETKCLVNASGPWVKQIDRLTSFSNQFPSIALVKGSHLIVKNRVEIKKNYILQTKDDRIIFVIQYLKDFLLIGTTESTIDENQLENQLVDSDETTYLLNSVNQSLNTDFNDSDIVHQYTGTRALYDEKTHSINRLSRDYHLSSETNGSTMYLTVFGGKVTTYRKLSTDAYKIISSILNFNKKPVVIEHDEIQQIKKRNLNVQSLHKNYKKKNRREIDTLIHEIIYAEQAIEFDDLVLRRTKLQILLTKEQLSEIKNKFFN